MIIYTVCRYGECISPEVLQGVVDTGCQLMVFSSWTPEHGKDRTNICDNWKTAMRFFEDEIFIGMDSDIVLRHESVMVLLKALKAADFVFIATNPGNTHGLWGIRRTAMEKVPFEYYTDDCPICHWRMKLQEKGMIVERVMEHEVRHTNRITLKEAEHGE